MKVTITENLRVPLTEEERRIIERAFAKLGPMLDFQREASEIQLQKQKATKRGAKKI